MKPKHLLAAALLPLALLAAGCSDDEESGSSDTTETTETTETTAPAADAAMPIAMGPAVDLEQSEQYNIAEIASGTQQTQTLTRLVIQAGLVGTLATGGPFTVIAPVNEAFAAIPPETLISVSQDTQQLTTVLTLHVIPGVYTSEDLKELDGQSLETVQGGKLLVEVNGDDILVGGATVAIPDITASNGVIHAVDTVIVEPNG
jgi:uncharacterized surface protein with fasciclin (FAS1) repeats